MVKIASIVPKRKETCKGKKKTLRKLRDSKKADNLYRETKLG